MLRTRLPGLVLLVPFFALGAGVRQTADRTEGASIRSTVTELAVLDHILEAGGTISGRVADAPPYESRATRVIVGRNGIEDIDVRLIEH